MSLAAYDAERANEHADQYKNCDVSDGQSVVWSAYEYYIFNFIHH